MPGGFAPLPTQDYNSALRAFTYQSDEGVATELACRLMCLNDANNAMTCDFYVHNAVAKQCQLCSFAHEQSPVHEGTFQANPVLQVKEGTNQRRLIVSSWRELHHACRNDWISLLYLAHIIMTEDFTIFPGKLTTLDYARYVYQVVEDSDHWISCKILCLSTVMCQFFAFSKTQLKCHLGNLVSEQNPQLDLALDDEEAVFEIRSGENILHILFYLGKCVGD